MRTAFLFRVPGHHGMYDFESVASMGLRKTDVLEVTEQIHQNDSRSIGKMSVSAILSKFG